MVGGTWSRGGVCGQRGVSGQGGLPFSLKMGDPTSQKWETPAPTVQEYCQCAVGTHPTGMHSFIDFILVFN